MTTRQIELLKQCIYGLDIHTLSEEDTETLLWLANEKRYCHPVGDLLISTVYVLTPGGAEYLYQSEQNEKQKAEETRKYNEQIAKADEDRQKQFKHDWRIAIFSSVFGFVSGLIIEHFFNILSFFF